MKRLYRDLIVALAATGLTFSAMTFAQSHPPLKSSVFNWNKIEVKPTPNGSRRVLFDAPTATMQNFECHVTTLEAGKIAHPPHRHPDEELVIVKEGTLEIMINGETQSAPTGSMIFYSSNDLHGMRNIGEGEATYYVLRWITSTTPNP